VIIDCFTKRSGLAAGLHMGGGYLYGKQANTPRQYNSGDGGI